MYIFVIILILVVLSIFGISVAHIFGILLITDEQIKVLPAIVISLGVLIASLSYLRDKKKHGIESDLKRDEFQLQITKQGLSEVYELLGSY